MDVYLQVGYGMLAHCRELISRWGAGTAILSPRDLDASQLFSLSTQLQGLGGAALLDPQFYVPDANHHRLVEHEYWPGTVEEAINLDEATLQTLVTDLHGLNDALGTSAFILPGVFAEQVDSNWADVHQLIAERAAQLAGGRPLLATIALSSDATRAEAQVQEVLEATSGWPIDGAYIVCQTPGGNYLVDDPNWLANVLDLAAGFKLRSQRVIIGYSNHQMLIASTSGADAIASGTWMNVRSFSPDKFVEGDDTVRQRRPWYYCPQALTEFRIPFLDVASRLGVLDRMAPSPPNPTDLSSILFTGALPSATGFAEPDAFRHYLATLAQQAGGSTLGSFDESVAHHEAALDAAELLLDDLHAARVTGQMRDFSEFVDVNRAAIALHIANRGAALRRAWPTI